MAFPAKAVALAGRAASTVRKFTPQILMTVGAVTSVCAVIEAVKKTPDMEEIIEKHNEKKAKAKEALECGEPEFGEREYKVTIGKIYISTIWALVKNFAKPIIFELVSLLCFLAMFITMSNTIKVTTAALATSMDMYNSYRERVIEEIGEEKEEKIRLGLDKVTAESTIVDANGKEKKVKQKLTVAKTNPRFSTPYDFFWGEGDPGFDQSMELNLMRIHENDAYLNKCLWGNPEGRDAAAEHNLGAKLFDKQRGIVPFVSLNDWRKMYLTPIEAVDEFGQFAGNSANHPDGVCVTRAVEADIFDDPDHPSHFRHGLILSPNIAGSILNRYKIEEK